jgi:hypothetical protein
MNRSVWSCALLTGGALGYYLLFGRGHLAEIAARHAEMADAYARFEAAERQGAQEAALLDASARLDHWREELTPALTFDPASPELQLVVMNALRSDGLVVNGTEQPQSERAAGRSSQRVRVTVQGPLPRIVAAICRLENAPTPTRVVELTLQAADASVARGELTVVRTWSESEERR